MRAVQSFASKVGNRDFRRKYKGNSDQPIQNGRKKITVIARTLKFFFNEA